MRRPVGVSILAVLFLGFAGFWICLGFSDVFTGGEDFATEAAGMLEFVVAFLFAALGMGLWELEEDARRASIALFSVPASFATVAGLISALYERPAVSDLAFGFLLTMMTFAPAAYLMCPRVRGTFNQMMLLNLGNKLSALVRG
jgi:hypothetical protein